MLFLSLIFTMESTLDFGQLEPQTPTASQQQFSQPLQPKKPIKKALVAEILAQMPDPKEINFEPLCTGPLRAAEGYIPIDTDESSAYELFMLFIPESLWEIMSRNTNMYAASKQITGGPKEHQRRWVNTSPQELKIFIGIQIYMGVHKTPNVEAYWNNNLIKGPIHTVRLYMSLYRFQQLKRYFHISQYEITGDWPAKYLTVEPTEEEEATQYNPELLRQIWWHKVEPAISALRSASQHYYKPSSNVSVDEIMVRSFGRSSHTYKMPNKPISQGYKIFAIADHGYIYSFTPTSRTKGLVEIIKNRMMTITGSMAFSLIKTLPRDKIYYTVYLDNYFTSIELFKKLREIQIGACGTTRPDSAGKDFPAMFKSLKSCATYVPYHHLCAIEVEQVLCFAWQDNNIVLGLTTVHTVDKTEDFIIRTRRRPQKTSTNGPLVHRAFGDAAVKDMPIPRIINDYNFHMGGVDIANQHRAAYETHMRAYRSWWPLWNWILDTATINAWKIQCVRRTGRGEAIISHLDFREALYMKLFSFKDAIPTRKRKAKLVDLPDCRLDRSLAHTPYQRPNEIRTRCQWCLHVQDKRPRADYFQKVGAAKISRWGCAACRVALCRPGLGRDCFEKWHAPLEDDGEGE